MAGEGKPRRIGIIGFGHLGRYLTRKVQVEGQLHGLQLAFVWNSNQEKMEGKVQKELQLESLSELAQRRADLVVEVAHPQIAKEYGEEILKHADFMVGSPTAFAEQGVDAKCREAARRHGHTLYVPSGALWGAEDIQKMADRGTLKALKVTMSKHPDSFKLEGYLQELKERRRGERTVLYEGPVRSLCPLAPNNVNTMAAAAVAAHSLGFDRVQCCLVADPSLLDWHVVDIEVSGPVDEASGHQFTVKSTRRNPSTPGAVTGAATYASFWSSVLNCKGHGGKLFLC
ncbi:aspartate dehydrogenase domain-containing protein [Pristis pectinata]|uniref:aspartate dehydrogenase domain-containing protein n=1 Tax=Pristis pectinata TaxID=685728 RepID=UPI00223E18FA|nr:aspartate dehydrogenase domain-containing protein [Pristis pectinata]XP_051896972.1 aspartate dehydrogenase domain-containing protein [Pristis pectinata]